MAVFCTSCGQENRAGASFCDNCGSGLASACLNCGTENRAGARFCSGCGTALAAPTTAGTGPAEAVVPPAASARLSATPSGASERRLVSVLFADLVAFTHFSEGRDPELVRDTLSRYFEATRQVIEHHGGRVEKFIGDAVMAAWGAPKANEDDAERAVRAALEVVEAVRNLDVGLDARVAVLTGQAAVTVGATDQGMVAGDLVNTAARLQAVAPPSGVLVGEATMLAAASAIAFEPVGEQALKGKQVPVPAWRALRVVSDRGGRSRGEGLEPPFVGRELELRLLKDLLHAIREEQRPRLISITGPAGIGKSRLAWELEKYADGLVEDIFWHRGRTPSYGEGVTFWALGEMVRRRAGLAEGDDEATTRERIRATVDEYVPEADDRAWVEPALLALLGVEPPPAGGRDRLFAAWRIFFERIARRGTTVLLFEDLHWADGGQLDFIDHLLEWSRHAPLLVITLARPELLERRSGWGTSARSFNAIGLEPLSDHHMRALLLGLVPDLPDAAVRSVQARADGIPLYAVETVRMLIADGRLSANDDGTYRPTGDLGQLAIPDTLRALVASRLDALDPVDRALLQDAAVLGKTFSHEALLTIFGSEDVQRTDARLRALVKRELLEVSVDPRSSEHGQFGFVQSVIRDVAYDTLSRRDRRARHLAAARYFESRGDDELAGVLANHYLAACQASEPGPEAEALQVQARLALRAAADRAVTLGAPDQALVMLGQALDITAADAERGELLERAAHAADIDARYDDAQDFARQAIEAYQRADDRSATARASALLGGILSDASRVVEAAAFLEEALAQAEAPEDIETRADILARLSRAHMRLGHNDEAVRWADQALAIAEPRRLDRIVAEAFVNKGSAQNGLGRLRESALLTGAAVTVASQVGDVALELRARNNYAATLAMEDQALAIQAVREAYELATRVGVPQMAQWLVGTYALGACYSGRDWDTALEMLDVELERSRSAADRDRLLSGRQYLMTWRGEDTTAIRTERERYREAQSDPDHEAWTQIYHALEALVSGRFEEAIAGYRRAIPLAVQTDIDARYGLIRAAHWGRDLVAAREALRETEVGTYSGRYIEGQRILAFAGVAALEGRSSEAMAGIREAVEIITRGGFLLDAALARLSALYLLPDETSLLGWADEARERFEAVKSPPLLARLEQAVSTRVAM